MRLFVRMIEPQQRLAVLQPAVEHPLNLVITHQLPEHGQIHVAKPLPLAQAPVFMTARQQVSLVKVGGAAQDFYLIRLQLLRRHIFDGAVCMLEGRNVHPDIRLRIDPDLVGVDHQQITV